MRELKFRVWSKDQKTYDYKFPYNSIGDFYVNTRGKVFSDFGNTVVPEVRQEAFIIEQYTGLKDENGKEIYEGDILKRVEDGGFDIVGEVEWSEKAARFWVNRYYYPGGGKWEVIGNVHENKELVA